MESGKVRILIFFCCFAVFLSAVFFCGCVMLSATPVEIHVNIKNNSSGTIIIVNEDGQREVPVGQEREIIYWHYAAIITTAGYSKEIDLFHNHPIEIIKKSCRNYFSLKKVVIYTFEVKEEEIVYRTEIGERVYKPASPINYDEILFLREDVRENGFVTLKIKNSSATPIKLTSISSLRSSDGQLSDIPILNEIFQPTLLLPDMEYTMVIPSGKIMSEITDFQIETNCILQPALQCKIVKLLPHCPK